MEYLICGYLLIGFITGASMIIYSIKEFKEHPNRYEEGITVGLLFGMLIVCTVMGVIIPIKLLMDIKIK